MCFFFSSRRRHTRCGRDWSSDVCSSDLRSGSSRRSYDLPRRAGKPSTGRSRPGDRISQTREVCVMQNAETVLDVLRERGRRGLPCDELYRQLFNPDLYLMAYGRLYSNHGAMTAGADGETVDGM